MYSSGVTLRKPYGCTLVKGMRVPCVYSMFGVARDTSSSRSARCTLCLELPGRPLPAWSDLGRLVPLPRAPACFLVCEPSGCRARSVFGRRVICYIGATVDWALSLRVHCVLYVWSCVVSRRVIGVAQVDSSTLELPRAYSVGVVQRTLYLELLGRTLLFVVGVVCAYSMFGVARRTLVRSCASGLQHWSCLFNSASNRG